MFKFEQQGKDVYAYFENYFAFSISESEILSENNIICDNLKIFIDGGTIKVSSKSFEILSIIFENISKKDSFYECRFGDVNLKIYAENSTILNDKILIMGISGESEIRFEKISQNKPFKNLNFPAISAPLLTNKPPSFSATLYLDSAYSIPVFTYKDKQVLNIGLQTSIFYAQVICNIPLSQTSIYQSTVLLTAIFASGFQTSTALTIDNSNINYTGFRAKGVIDYTGFNNQNQNDGTAKLLISINPLVYQNRVKTRSLVIGGVAYNSLPSVYSQGLSTTKYYTPTSAFFSTAGISNQGIVTVGYSAISSNPVFYPTTSFLPNEQSIPGLISNQYISILSQSTSQSYNGFIGVNCSFGLGINSGAYPYIEALFILREDLNNTINLSSYNVNYSLIYSDGSIKVINQSSNNLQILNDGVQNYIFSRLNWTKYANPSLGLSSLQFQVSKQISVYPSELRLYECGLYSISPSNVFNIMSVKEYFKAPEEVNQKNLDFVNVGEIIYGYDIVTRSLVETKVLKIKNGKEEPVYKIYFRNHFVELPESTFLLTKSGFHEIWNIKIGDEIFVYPDFIVVEKVEISNYKPHIFIETDCGNYFADNVLVKF